MTKSGGILAMPKQDAMTRFMAKVEKHPSGCWVWCAQRDIGGYGRFTDETGIGVPAHRFMYSRTYGAVPDGYVLDHLCRNRACVNPDHLEAVTPRENIIRGESPNAILSRTGMCKWGHELTPDNIYRKPSRPNSAYCKVCLVARNKLRYRKNLGMADLVQGVPNADALLSRVPRPDIHGENNPFSRFDQSQVEAIRQSHAAGESLRSLARRFQTSHSHIGRIVSREQWPACALYYHATEGKD